jgi:hypothetical protein
MVLQDWDIISSKGGVVVATRSIIAVQERVRSVELKLSWGFDGAASGGVSWQATSGGVGVRVRELNCSQQIRHKRCT